MSATEFEFIDNGDGDYTVIAGDIAIEASRIRWQGDDLAGEVTILADGQSIGPLALSFMKSTSRRDVLAAIDGLSAAVAPALNDLCRQVIACERQNTSPVVMLHEVAKPSPDREYDVPLLPPLPRHHPSIWFGDGGTGKSVWALYTAGHLAKQGLRVLYADWEMDKDEHRLRYEQLFGAAMPTGMYYWRCDRPLPQISDAIRRTIRKHKIDYVVVDSIAFACGGSPESSDIAAQYANHTRSFGVGSLHIAHMTKDAKSGKLKPFGSVFWHNFARSSWFFDATKPTKRNGVSETDLLLHHRKSNFGPLEEQPRQLRYIAEPDRGRIRLASRMLGDSRLTVPERLRAMLADNGGQRREKLPDLLPGIERKTLNKNIQRGIKDEWLQEVGGVLMLKATA